ncbi:hypothetical protein B4153_5957 [Bacillus cereus]|nr:hypothetical protein B4153_5957 [Bacillus cereus]
MTDKEKQILVLKAFTNCIAIALIGLPIVLILLVLSILIY